MNRVFAWVMLVVAVCMLVLQLVIAEHANLLVVGFWSLILAFSVYVLFLKKPVATPGP